MSQACRSCRKVSVAWNWKTNHRLAHKKMRRISETQCVVETEYGNQEKSNEGEDCEEEQDSLGDKDNNNGHGKMDAMGIIPHMGSLKLLSTYVDAQKTFVLRYASDPTLVKQIRKVNLKALNVTEFLQMASMHAKRTIESSDIHIVVPAFVLNGPKTLISGYKTAMRFEIECDDDWLDLVEELDVIHPPFRLLLHEAYHQPEAYHNIAHPATVGTNAHHRTPETQSTMAHPDANRPDSPLIVRMRRRRRYVAKETVERMVTPRTSPKAEGTAVEGTAKAPIVIADGDDGTKTNLPTLINDCKNNDEK
ncbi:hypothetical protein DFH27DRAFT_656809 [Peziza echinospora]|nr:hypothetical protein DFH27DRAFT_656809 [Peziza echinospora]